MTKKTDKKSTSQRICHWSATILYCAHKKDKVCMDENEYRKCAGSEKE